MYRYVNWEEKIDNKDLAEWFIELAKLNSIDSQIIRDRRDGKPQYRTAQKIDKSVEYITKRMPTIMAKYIEISKQYDMFPKISNIKKKGYSDVHCIMTIKVNNNLYTVILNEGEYKNFEDMRLAIIDLCEEKYGIKLDQLENYEIYLNGHCSVSQEIKKSAN